MQIQRTAHDDLQKGDKVLGAPAISSDLDIRFKNVILRRNQTIPLIFQRPFRKNIEEQFKTKHSWPGSKQVAIYKCNIKLSGPAK